jgi:hypothetical protein
MRLPLKNDATFFLFPVLVLINEVWLWNKGLVVSGNRTFCFLF